MTRILLDFSGAITGGQVSRSKGIVSALQHKNEELFPLIVLKRGVHQDGKYLEIQPEENLILISLKPQRGLGRHFERLYLEFVLIHRLCIEYKVTTYVSFSHSLPRLPKFVKSVIGVSNIAPFLDYRKIQSDSALEPFRLLALRFNILRSIQSASKTIFISQFCADLVLESTNGKPDYVVLPSPIYAEKPTETDEGIDESNFIFFYPSHFYSYKNHIRLLEALRRLIETGIDAKLLLAGRPYNRGYYRRFLAACDQLGVSNNVITYHEVSHQKCLALMRNAYCVIYPSLAENFPTTYLESLHYARRVCCSNERPFIDFYHPNVYYFDPDDVASILTAMRSAIENSSLLLDYKESRNLLPSSWHEYTAQLIHFASTAQ
jgi:glycosyltransferase involved in cell wall biosynthesis